MPSPPLRAADLLAALSGHQVEFLVVGGIAAVLAGAPVVTADLDTLVRRSGPNLERLLATLRSLHAVYRDPAGRTIEPSAERLASLRLHLLDTDLGPLDVLTEVGAGLLYEDLVERSQAIDVRGASVRVLELQAVIETKEQAGRPKDLAMLPVLRETLRLQRERS